MKFLRITFRESVLKPSTTDELSQTLFAGTDYEYAWTDGAFIFLEKNDNTMAYYLGMLKHAEVELESDQDEVEIEVD